MESFCGGKYWDFQLTWNTTNPDFTPCFENTALVWSSCAFLWLFAPLDIVLSSHSVLPSTPRSPLSVTKYGLTSLLLIVQVFFLFFIGFGDSQTEWYYTADFVSAVVKAASYLLSLLLLYNSRRNGVRSSGVQFFFWLILCVTEALRFRTSLTAAINKDERIQTVDLIVELISFPCVFGVFILNCWADITPVGQRSYAVSKVKNPSPEKNSSFLSQILYEWQTPLIWKGYKFPLKYEDLWDLNEEDKSESLVPVFERQWDIQVEKAKLKKLKPKSMKAKDVYTAPKYSDDHDDSSSIASVIPALLGAFGGTFTFGVLLKFIPDILNFVSPQILDMLITYTEGSEPLWKGIFYAAILFFTTVISSIVLAKHNFIMFHTGLRARTVLISAVYRKVLRLSNAAKRKSTQGEIVNLMSVDVQKIMDLIPFINMMLSAPFQIAVAMYFLWGILGPSSMAGLVVMVLMIPANAVVVSKTRKYQVAQMRLKDQRIKMLNEILSGIKVLKLYAWEKSFEEQVMRIRRKEIETLKKAAYLNCITVMMWTCSQFLVSLTTFGTYVLIDDANVLDAQKAFVSLSLFNIITMPMNLLPMVVASVIQAMVSIKRVNKYMNSEEIDVTSVTHDPNEACPIAIDDGYFSWETNSDIPPTLRNINLRIEDGSLVAIVGPVGSGKSSLLSAVLGDINKITGRVNTKGSFAYVAQQAWIQNTTLKDNILFGKLLDPMKYDRIVESCDLLPDIEILPGGDKTEIGEKGINLSGGQKQRVSLARAAYNNADVYLLDDPLSAVDSHVGKHIFEKVLGPKGLLRRKTRILVTHGIAFLPQVDNIIVMKNGEISEIGTYRELLSRNGEFAEFLKQYVSEKGLAEELEDSDLIKDLEGLVGQIPVEKSKRTVSETSDSETDPGVRHRRLSRQQSSSTSADKPHGSKDIPPPESSKPESNKIIQIENSETASVSMSVYKVYFKAAGYWISLAIILLYFSVQGLGAGSSVWLSEWSNQPPAADGKQDISTRNYYLGVYGIFGVCQAVTIFGATILLAVGTLRSSSILHFNMLRQILHAPMHFFDTTPIGRILNRFAKDVDVCDANLPFNVRVWIIAISSVIATLTVISYSTPIFMVVIVPIGLVYYFAQRVFVCTSRQLRRLESVTRSPIYSHFGETIAGCSTIRAYGEEERFISESETKVDFNQLSYYPSIVAPRWLSVRLETIGNTVIFFAALFAVLGRDTLSSGLVGLSVSYALKITGALTVLVRWTSDLETNIVSVERMKEYGEIEQEADWSTSGKKPPKSWPSRGQILFNQYKTRYRTGLELVLKNLTCCIEPGEKVGIVGRTGAGKSSLTLALFRIIEPVHGSILIDGQDISRLGLHDLRGRITIIPQDPVLFSGTLRINLDPFEEHTDSTLWKALELSHLKSFVKTLPAGLQHEISEGGDNLSVGQRQLVCLARALLRKTKILVLDEATAAVDLETDDLIQETIRSEFKDSTVITIAHRLNTIMDSDRVMVLDKGEVKEFDSPRNLLNNENSLFYSLAEDAGIAPTTSPTTN